MTLSLKSFEYPMLLLFYIFEYLAIQTVLELLQADEALPEKYRDHALVSNWVGHRDCHIKPDLVLIYKKTEEGELLILKLVRLGSHSELAI